MAASAAPMNSLVNAACRIIAATSPGPRRIRQNSRTCPRQIALGMITGRGALYHPPGQPCLLEWTTSVLGCSTKGKSLKIAHPSRCLLAALACSCLLIPAFSDPSHADRRSSLIPSLAKVRSHKPAIGHRSHHRIGRHKSVRGGRHLRGDVHFERQRGHRRLRHKTVRARRLLRGDARFKGGRGHKRLRLLSFVDSHRRHFVHVPRYYSGYRRSDRYVAILEADNRRASDPQRLSDYRPPGPKWIRVGAVGNETTALDAGTSYEAGQERTNCLTVRTTITVDGKPVDAFGKACLQADGSWRLSAVEPNRE